MIIQLSCQNVINLWFIDLCDVSVCVCQMDVYTNVYKYVQLTTIQLTYMYIAACTEILQMMYLVGMNQCHVYEMNNCTFLLKCIPKVLNNMVNWPIVNSAWIVHNNHPSLLYSKDSVFCNNKKKIMNHVFYLVWWLHKKLTTLRIMMLIENVICWYWMFIKKQKRSCMIYL